MESRIEKLPNSELFIMNTIWGSKYNPDLYIIQEQVKINYKKEWKLQTIATFMKRLEKRGYITTYKVGRYSHYQALISKQQYRTMVMEEVIGLLFDNEKEKLLHCIEDIMGK